MTVFSSNSTSGHIPSQNWEQRLQPAWTEKPGAAACTQPKGKSSPVSTKRQAGKADGAWGDHEIIFSLRKERNCEPCCSLAEDRMRLETPWDPQEGTAPGGVSQMPYPPTDTTKLGRQEETGGHQGAEEERHGVGGASCLMWTVSARPAGKPPWGQGWCHGSGNAPGAAEPRTEKC